MVVFAPRTLGLSARIVGKAWCLAAGEEGGLSAEDAEHGQGMCRAEPLRSRRADEGGSFLSRHHDGLEGWGG